MTTREGWLEREAAWGIFNPWQRRYFVLHNNDLSWHHGPENVDDERSTVKIPWDISKCVLTDRQDLENCFMIHSSVDGRTLLVRAPRFSVCRLRPKLHTALVAEKEWEICLSY